MRFKLYHLLFLFLLSCSPNSVEDFRSEGESLCRSLYEDLQKIHSKEEAVKLLPRLQKKYRKIAHLLILSAQFYEKHPEQALYEADREGKVNTELSAELERLYKIPGMRELLEKAQKAALLELDKSRK